jgi:preprotein translocase subunit SecG
METLLYIVVIFSCLILIGAVLLQPSKGGGISALGGSSQSVFGSTGGTTFLFRATMIAAAIIMVGSIIITRVKVKESTSTVIDSVPLLATPPAAEQSQAPAPSTAPATDAPANTPAQQ